MYQWYHTHGGETLLRRRLIATSPESRVEKDPNVILERGMTEKSV